jgi:hypothetical protein
MQAESPFSSITACAWFATVVVVTVGYGAIHIVVPVEQILFKLGCWATGKVAAEQARRALFISVVVLLASRAVDLCGPCR